MNEMMKWEMTHIEQFAMLNAMEMKINNVDNIIFAKDWEEKCTHSCRWVKDYS